MDAIRLSLVLAALGALLSAPASAPAAASDGPDVRSAGAEVIRLYEEAARAAAEHERGRRAAAAQRARAAALQRRLERRRSEVAELHDAVGAVARAQYRAGGPLAFTARLLLADDPGELLRGRRYARQAAATVSGLLEASRSAERRLTSAEERARAARHELTAREARLAADRRSIEIRLDKARRTLQRESGRRAAAGRCAGAVRSAGRGPARRKAAWVLPVAHYELSARFGGAGAHWARRHTGQDFAVRIGEPVRSVGTGRVLSVSCGGAFGVEIVVRHPGGYYTQYAHLASVAVAPGERVRPGQRIGLAGTTGNSTGPHLHFEVRLTPQQGSGVDPWAWLRERDAVR